MKLVFLLLDFGTHIRHKADCSEHSYFFSVCCGRIGFNWFHIHKGQFLSPAFLLRRCRFGNPASQVTVLSQIGGHVIDCANEVACFYCLSCPALQGSWGEPGLKLQNEITAWVWLSFLDGGDKPPLYVWHCVCRCLLFTIPAVTVMHMSGVKTWKLSHCCGVE